MTRSMTPGSLLYSLLAGPVIWFAHFLLVWGVAEFGCRINFRNMVFVSPTSIQLFVVVATVVGLVAVAIGGMLAYRGWTSLEKASQSGWAYEDRYRFLTLVAILLNALFFFSIIFTAMPSFFLDICDLAA